MITVIIGKDGKKRKVITQQYTIGTYIAVYEENDPIPVQLTSQSKEVDYHRKLRKKTPDFVKEESSEIPEKTKVIFRKFKNGEIIAIFPEIQADEYRSMCQSYMHVGQHGAATYAISFDIGLATPEEYADLKAELESIGYDLDIRKRIGKRWFEVIQK
jgi:hypothetical protein